jgi:hypothetical protein
MNNSPPTSGIGEIRATTPAHEKTGFFTLTSKQEGITAAHIMEESMHAQVTLQGQTYQATGWRAVEGRPEAGPIGQDLAWVTLEKAPPEGVRRWSTNPMPPKKENFLVAKNPKNPQWATFAPRDINDYTASAFLPTKTYQGLRTISGDHKAKGPKLAIGDSGGPWLQNGQIAAITARIQTQAAGPRTQDIYGAGTWQAATGPWPTPGTPWPLIAALLALCIAKYLAGKSRRAYNKT